MRALGALPFAERIAADRGDAVTFDDAPRGLSVGGKLKPAHSLPLLFGRGPRLTFPRARRRARQAKIFAQGLAGVVFMEQAAALQLWNDVVDEIRVGSWHIGCRNDKAVAAATGEHFFKLVGDLLSSADDGVRRLATATEGDKIPRAGIGL